MIDPIGGRDTALAFIPGGRARTVRYTPDGRQIVTAGGDNIVRRWDATTGAEMRVYRGLSDAVFTPEASTFVAPVGRQWRVWSVPRPDVLVRLEPTQQYVTGSRPLAAAFRPTGDLLAVWTQNAFFVVDIKTGRVREHPPGVNVMGAALTFSADGTRVTLSGREHVFDPATRKPVERTWEQERDAVTGQLLAERHGKPTPRGDALNPSQMTFFPRTSASAWDAPLTDYRSTLTTPDGTLVLSASVSGRYGVRPRFPNGQFVAPSQYKGPVASEIVEVRTGRVVLSVPGTWRNYLETGGGRAQSSVSVAFSGDETMCVSTDGQAVVGWDLATGKERYRLPIGASTNWTRFAADEFFLSDGSALMLRDISTGHVRQTYVVSAGATPTRTFATPDKRRGCVLDSQGALHQFDLATGTKVNELRVGELAPQVQFSADGRFLNSVGPRFSIWDLRTGRERLNVPFVDDYSTIVTTSPDGNIVASVGTGGRVRLLDARPRSAEPEAVEVDRLLFTAVAPPPRPVQPLPPIRAFARNKGEIIAVAWDADGRHAYARDSGVFKLDTETGTVVWTEDAGTGLRLAATADGRFVAVGGDDGMVRLLDPKTGKELDRFKAHAGRLVALVAAPTGTLLATATDAEKPAVIRVWDAATRKLVCTLEGHSAAVWGVAFDATGKRLATASDDGTVRVWDAATGKEQQVFRGHVGMVSAVAFSPDGKLLASTGQDRTVRVWDIAGKKQVEEFKGHASWGRDVVFAPDNRRIISVAWNPGAWEVVRVWELGVGAQQSPWFGQQSGQAHPVLSPDGRFVLLGREQSVLRLPLPLARDPERR